MTDSGIYVRVKREGAYRSTLIEDCTDDEIKAIVDTSGHGRLASWMCSVISALRESHRSVRVISKCCACGSEVAATLSRRKSPLSDNENRNAFLRSVGWEPGDRCSNCRGRVQHIQPSGERPEGSKVRSGESRGQHAKSPTIAEDAGQSVTTTEKPPVSGLGNPRPALNLAARAYWIATTHADEADLDEDMLEPEDRIIVAKIQEMFESATSPGRLHTLAREFIEAWDGSADGEELEAMLYEMGRELGMER